MNKRGFTLTELLAVIAIIGIISLIAIPNIVNISENVKKDNMLNDAQRFISLAKLEVNSDYDIRNFSKTGVCTSTSCTFYIENLNKNGDFKINDSGKIIAADGLSYDSSSYVKYEKVLDELKYCIYLKSEKRYLSSATAANCVDEGLLTDRDTVKLEEN